MVIRDCGFGDLEEINNIYNESVLNSTATFDTEPKTTDERIKWFLERNKRFAVIVAEIDGKVAGWASLNQYSDRKAYEGTCENSLYVSPDYRKKGVGKALLKATIEKARTEKFHSILSRITVENGVSIAMHEAEGFYTVGIMREVGVKFERLLDVALMQIIL